MFVNYSPTHRLQRCDSALAAVRAELACDATDRSRPRSLQRQRINTCQAHRSWYTSTMHGYQTEDVLGTSRCGSHVASVWRGCCDRN